MFRNYLSIALRNLIKNKLYSAINIIGLAVGLAACMLIFLFVRDELSFDQHWAKADSIARIHVTLSPPGREPFVLVQSPGRAKSSLEDFFAQEIERVGRIARFQPVMMIDGQARAEGVNWVDSSLVEMFDFSVVAGDLQAAMSDNASLAVSTEFAERVFGTSDVLDRVVNMTTFGLQRDYKIAAVYVNPGHSVVNLPAMAMIDEEDWRDQSYFFEQWFSVNTQTYFELKDGVGLDSIANRLTAFTDASIPTDNFPPGVKPSDFVQFNVMMLKDLRLYAEGQGEYVAGGDADTVMVFSAIAILILIIACINFMNLATAKSTQRAREVALRKVLGAQRKTLILQFLGESALVAVLSLILSVVVVEISLPAFAAFTEKDLTLDLLSGQVAGAMISLVVMVGLIGGFYPALVLSGFRPARVLKANKSSEIGGSAGLRNVLVVLQFSISIALITATAVVYGQKLYATSLNPGFSKDNVLVVQNLSRQGASEMRSIFAEQVRKLPGVVAASLLSEVPANGNENNNSVTVPGRPPEETTLIGVQNVDEHFLDAFKIDLVAGRGFDRDIALDRLVPYDEMVADSQVPGNVLVNQMALRKLGFPTDDSALGMQFVIGRNGGEILLTIVGILPDMNFQSIRRVIRPEMIFYDEPNFRNLAIKFEGDPQELVDRVQALWTDMIPSVPFAYHYTDEALAEEFREEAAVATMLAVFAALAVVIACLGLYGLAAFTAERRTKEIGVRKVLGARVRDIVQLLIWQFSKPVLIANLIAWPLTAWAMLSWLETFPVRLDAWVLIPLSLIAGLAALAIAWVTVGGNAARVARSKPISALRYE